MVEWRKKGENEENIKIWGKLKVGNDMKRMGKIIDDE
jgi:hypothetical protein